MSAGGSKAGRVAIGQAWVTESSPCFVIAEVGVNHNGSVPLAVRLVESASRARANAVKFQSFHADQLVTTLAEKPAYQRSRTPSNESQHHLLRSLELTFEQQRAVADHCRRVGIQFLSTPFDSDSADFLEELGVPAFKFASGELTNHPLLRHVAKKGRTMIVSTGMASLSEVEEAVRVVLETGNHHLILLHCLSAYPADAAEVNLRAMETMAIKFRVPIGYSDHTVGTEVALAAVARGARVLEKHMTMDRSLPGPDHVASIEPEEFATMVRAIRVVEQALGDGNKRRMPSEQELAKLARRSVFTTVPISADTKILPHMLSVRRPAIGLPPSMLEQLIGRTVSRDVAAETPISLDDVV